MLPFSRVSLHIPPGDIVPTICLFAYLFMFGQKR